jgi:hypothetical protein
VWGRAPSVPGRRTCRRGGWSPGRPRRGPRRPGHRDTARPPGRAGRPTTAGVRSGAATARRRRRRSGPAPSSRTTPARSLPSGTACPPGPGRCGRRPRPSGWGRACRRGRRTPAPWPWPWPPRPGPAGPPPAGPGRPGPGPAPRPGPWPASPCGWPAAGQRPHVPVDGAVGHPGGHGQLVEVARGQDQLQRHQRPAGVQVADVAGIGVPGRLEGQLGPLQGLLVPVGRLDEPVQPGLGGGVGLGQGLHLEVEPGHLLLEPGPTTLAAETVPWEGCRPAPTAS